MSWNDYITSLKSSNHVSKGAICGIDGTVWACSEDFKITGAEVQTLVRGFNDPTLLQSGIHLGGDKFIYLQSDDQQIQGKKGSAGVSVGKALRCLVIGVYQSGQIGGNCRTAVESLRDYLVSSQY